MYCIKCGNEIPNGSKFCILCGAKVEPMQPVNAPVPTSQPPVYNTPIAKARPRAKRQTGGVVAIIAAGLAVVLAFEFIIGPTVSGKTIFGEKTADSGNAASAEVVSTGSAVVSQESPVVEIDGVTVDVNALNLNGDETLTVQTYEQSLGDDGFKGEEYEISLGDMHYLRAPMTVTFPYDKSAAADSMVCVLHYDSDYELWIPQATETDLGARTVSINLTTLSPTRVVYFDKEYSNSLYYIEDKGSIDAKFKVSYNYWEQIEDTPMEPAQIVAQDYIANGNTNASTMQLLNAADDAMNSFNSYYTLFGAFADTVYSAANTIADAGGTLKNVTDKASKGIGVLSLLIAGSQLVFDLATKDDDKKNETAANLYKNIATNTGTLYSFCTGYSSAALSFGFLGVAVTGYMLDTLVDEAETIQAETVEAVFDAYYSEHSTFDEKDWYNMFVDAYWDAWQNGRNSEEGINDAIKKVTDAIDAHAEEFWNVIYGGGSDALTFAVADAGKTNYYTPTKEQKAELTARFKKDLFNRFNEKTIPWINEFMLERAQVAVYSSLRKAVEPYNKYYRIQIQETVTEDGDEKCKYQMCPIRFGTEEGFITTDYPGEWALLAPQDDREWTAYLDVTLLGYMMAGMPDKVFLFDPWDENKKFGDQIETRDLVLAGEDKEYTTVIDLSVTNKKITKLTYTNSVFTFEQLKQQLENNESIDPLDYAMFEAGNIPLDEDGNFSFSSTGPSYSCEKYVGGYVVPDIYKVGPMNFEFTGKIDMNALSEALVTMNKWGGSVVIGEGNYRHTVDVNITRGEDISFSYTETAECELEIRYNDQGEITIGPKDAINLVKSGTMTLTDSEGTEVLDYNEVEEGSLYIDFIPE